MKDNRRAGDSGEMRSRSLGHVCAAVTGTGTGCPSIVSVSVSGFDSTIRPSQEEPRT